MAGSRESQNHSTMLQDYGCQAHREKHTHTGKRSYSQQRMSHVYVTASWTKIFNTNIHNTRYTHTFTDVQRIGIHAHTFFS